MIFTFSMSWHSGKPQEADIGDKLRTACRDSLSLVATENDRIVGHILFSPAVIEGREGLLRGMGLAPAFMIRWLDKSKIPQAGGLARYREEFNEAV